MNTPDRHPHHSTGKTAAIRLLTAVTVAALLCVTFFVARHVGTECGRDNARRDIMQANDITAGPKRLMAD